MFAQKLIRGSFALALALSAGTAFADQPQRGGYRNSVVTTECIPEAADAPSYRDAVARLGTSKDVRVVSIGSAGYRDQYARIPSVAQARQVALASGLACTTH